MILSRWESVYAYIKSNTQKSLLSRKPFKIIEDTKANEVEIETGKKIGDN